MHLKLLAARALLLGSVVFMFTPRSAHADVTGSWAGYSQSSVVARPFQTSELDISTENSKSQISGGLTLQFGDGSVHFTCDGSVTTANVVSLQGKSANGLIIVVCRGKIAEFGDGSVHFAALQYTVSSSNTRLDDNGYLALVQRAGGLNWGRLAVPAVQGNWQGPWESNITRGKHGPADLSVTSHLGSSFGGTLEFDVVSSTGLAASLFKGGFQATVTLPAVQDGVSDTLIIGADSSRGVIAILIGLLLPAVQKADGSPAEFQGSTMLFHSLADVYRGVWNGTNTFYDRGAYLLPAVQ